MTRDEATRVHAAAHALVDAALQARGLDVDPEVRLALATRILGELDLALPPIGRPA